MYEKRHTKSGAGVPEAAAAGEFAYPLRPLQFSDGDSLVKQSKLSPVPPSQFARAEPILTVSTVSCTCARRSPRRADSTSKSPSSACIPARVRAAPSVDSCLRSPSSVRYMRLICRALASPMPPRRLTVMRRPPARCRVWRRFASAPYRSVRGRVRSGGRSRVGRRESRPGAPPGSDEGSAHGSNARRQAGDPGSAHPTGSGRYPVGQRRTAQRALRRVGRLCRGPSRLRTQDLARQISAFLEREGSPREAQ